MPKFILIIIAACVTVACSSIDAVASSGERIALVIGNSKYQKLTPLDNPKIDAIRLAKMLKDNGFEVYSCDGKTPGCLDLSGEAFERVIQSFSTAAKKARLALFFYAGHGMESQGVNVAIPIDATIDCASGEVTGGVPVDDIISTIDSARSSIVVLDACRNDPLANICPKKEQVRQQSFKSFKIPSSNNFLLVSSTKPGQVALDGVPGAHSPFARNMFSAFGTSSNVYFHQIFDQVAKAVILETSTGRLTQIPEILIRGGSPEECLSGVDCASDPKSAVIVEELKALRADRARDQELTTIAQSYLQALGVRAVNRPLSEDERVRVLAGIREVGQTLANNNDAASEAALEKLKSGDSDGAETLFSQVLAEEEQAARLAEERAEKKRRDAAKAARNIALLARPKDIAKALSYLERAVRLNSDAIEAWIDLGETARDAGKLKLAEEAFQRALDTASSHSESILPIKATYRLSDVARATGRLGDAKQFSVMAFDRAKALATGNPTSATLKRELSVTLEKLGDVDMSGGAIAPAIQNFRDALEIRRELSKAAPNDVNLLRDVSIALNKIGDAEVLRGNDVVALDIYREAKGIRQRLAQADPAGGSWKADLSVSNDRVGDLLLKKNQLFDAYQEYKASLALRETLVLSDPRHTGWQHFLSVSTEKLGDLSVRQGRLAEGLIQYQESRMVRERLTQLDPTNMAWLRDLSISMNKIADVQKLQGNLELALAVLSESADIREVIQKSDPSNQSFQIDIGVAHARKAHLLASLGRKEEARLLLDRTIEKLRPIVEGSDNTAWAGYLKAMVEERRSLGR